MSEIINIKNLQKKAEQAKIAEIQVHTIMTQKVISVKHGISIRATIELLKINRISGVPVVDNNNKLIGFISEGDLLLQAASENLNSPITYRTKVETVGPTTLLKKVIELLYARKRKGIPVVNQNNTLVGIVSRIDVLAKIVSSS